MENLKIVDIKFEELKSFYRANYINGHIFRLKRQEFDLRRLEFEVLAQRAMGVNTYPFFSENVLDALRFDLSLEELSEAVKGASRFI